MISTQKFEAQSVNTFNHVPAAILNYIEPLQNGGYSSCVIKINMIQRLLIFLFAF